MEMDCCRAIASLVVSLILIHICESYAHPCAKMCVCFDCPISKQVIVNCSGKSLSSVPAGIPINATRLLLNNNSLSQIQSSSFQELSHLEDLDVSSNSLSHLKNGSFVGLANLKRLSLNNNNLNLSRVSFYPGIFKPLQNLTFLNLKSNNITEDGEATFQYLDYEIADLSSLKELYLDGVSNVIFGAEYGKLRHLNAIDLSGSGSLETLGAYTFSNLARVPVKFLNISHCQLTAIHPDTFKPLAEIDTIDMSYNTKLELRYVGIGFAGLQFSPIRRIFAQMVHQSPTLTFLHQEDLKYLKYTQLEELYLDNNRIAQIDSNLILSAPKTLRVLSISWNSIQTYKAQMYQLLLLRNLEFVYADYQEVDGPESGTSYISNSRSDSNPPSFVDLSSFLEIFPEYGKPSSSGFLTLSLPPNLTEVHICCTYKMRFTIPNMRLEAPKARKVDLSYNLLHRWKGPIMGLETLEYLDLSGNACYELSPGFFSYFRDLKTLRIADNLFGPTLDEGTFSGLCRLQTLTVHTNRLEDITPGLFTDLRCLRVLDLSNNYITSWGSRIDHMANLTVLNMTSNKLSSLPTELLNDLDEISKHGSTSISLDGNQLVCNCNTKYFTEWLMHTKVRILNANTTYCRREHGNRTSLARPELQSTYDFLQVHCQAYTASIVISSCIIVIAVCIVAGKILHRYRWKLRYLYYMAQNTKERTGYERLHGDDQDRFTFDAFISYEDAHRDFVRLEMLPSLETEGGLRLCIDKRDFIPGFYVADNIMNAIQNSRKTVVLLSKKFLESKWCMYEFNMARMESIHSDRHSLLVILMEPYPAKELSPEFLEILHSKSYITKTEDPDGMALFWRQLIAGIRLDKTSDVAVI